LRKPETFKAYKRKQSKGKSLYDIGQDISNEGVWKDTVIPDGFVMVIDTREQIPLFVGKDKYKFNIERYALKNGDYSVKGYENLICIERKMVSDFFGYLGKERDKTCEKLERMSEYYFKALVIEADEEMLYAPQEFTTLTKEHVRGFLKSIRVRYGMHVYCNSKVEYIERYVLDHLTYAYKKLSGIEEAVPLNVSSVVTNKQVAANEPVASNRPSISSMIAQCKTLDDLYLLACGLGYNKRWAEYMWEGRVNKHEK